MLIRSSRLLIDEGFCAAQGYAGALLYNASKASCVINPVQAAIACAGIALSEKILKPVVDKYVPGSHAFIGPIPVGIKSITNLGLALSLTFKIMKLAGLILTVPPAIANIGLACTVVVMGGMCLKIMCILAAAFSASNANRNPAKDNAGAEKL